MESAEKVFPKALAGARRGVDQAAEQTHEAIDKVCDAAAPAVNRVTSGAHEAVDRIADAATYAADTLGAKSGQIKDAQVRLMEDYGAYVREHPFTSLGIVVAVGFLIGKLTSFR